MMDPGALRVDFDLPVVFQTPGGSSDSSGLSGDVGLAHLRIYGIPISEIAQSADYTWKPIKIYGGMGEGLPLAKPEQSGLLVDGLIVRSWANWIGTLLTHDFSISGNPQAPNQFARNFVHNPAQGESLSSSVPRAVQNSGTGLTAQMNIHPDLAYSFSAPGVYPNLSTFADNLNTISRNIMNDPEYLGIRARVSGNTVYFYDFTQPANKTTTIDYTDLVGQPTWISPNTLQITCVLRADLSLGDAITLPPLQGSVSSGLSAPGSEIPPSLRNTLLFEGNFGVLQIRHVGNYKSPDALQWVTIITAYTTTTPSYASPPPNFRKTQGPGTEN
jgi:hypothetical protein